MAIVYRCTSDIGPIDLSLPILYEGIDEISIPYTNNMALLGAYFDNVQALTFFLSSSSPDEWALQTQQRLRDLLPDNMVYAYQRGIADKSLYGSKIYSPSGNKYMLIEAGKTSIYSKNNELLYEFAATGQNGFSSRGNAMYSIDSVEAWLDGAYNESTYISEYNHPENGLAFYNLIKYQDTEEAGGSLRAWWLFLRDEPYEDAVPDDDPYGGNTGGGGGGGVPLDGTPIGFPDLPSLNFLGLGMISLYNPSVASLQALASYLWDQNFIEDIKKIMANPFDAIVSLNIIPVSLSTVNSVCKIGNCDTGVSMPRVTNQWVIVNCGTVKIEERWGSFLDYKPFTTVKLFLPFIGIVSVYTNDVINQDVNIRYMVDVITGSASCLIACGGTVKYHYNTNIITSCPISGQDFSTKITGMIQGAAKMLGSGISGNVGGAIEGMIQAGANAWAYGSGCGDIEYSGQMSATHGLMDNRTPYFIIERPALATPENQVNYIGYPSAVECALSTCSGFTSVDVIHLDGVTCTDAERSELEALLKGGVIL